MDPIKAALKKAKKGEQAKQIIVAEKKEENKEENKDLALSDNLLVRYFMSHLDKEKVKTCLGDPGKEIRQKLIMVDTYAAQNGQKDIYSFIEEPIHLNSWTAFLTSSLEKKLIQFNFRLFGDPGMGKPFQEKIAEDVLNKYLDYDFSAFQQNVRLYDENMFVVVNNLLKINPESKDLDGLGSKLDGKIGLVRGYLKKYNIDMSKGLDSLYLINGIKELKS